MLKEGEILLAVSTGATGCVIADNTGTGAAAGAAGADASGDTGTGAAAGAGGGGGGDADADTDAAGAGVAVADETAVEFTVGAGVIQVLSLQISVPLQSTSEVHNAKTDVVNRINIIMGVKKIIIFFIIGSLLSQKQQFKPNCLR